MHISLIGYMGSGKSTIAPLLADELGAEWVDLDAYIETQNNISIAEYIRNKGELAFRKLERDALFRVIESKNNLILGTGGGTPCYYNNMDVLLEKSFCVYLQRTPGELYNILKNQHSNRPVLDGIAGDALYEFIAKHLFDRRPYYERAAFTVKCGTKSSREIASEIIREWTTLK